VDLPDQPDEPRRVERADPDRQTPKPHERPDPGERGRYYEAMHALVSAETAPDASRGRGPDGTDQRNYWNEVPRFLEAKADLERRWPAEQRPAVDRSADPPGSYRSDGGFYLSPHRHAEMIAAIGRMREAEPGISAAVRATERDNRVGGWLEGFDCRMKGENRLKEKVAEQLKSEPRTAATDVLQQIPDAIRYTFCLEPDGYARGYYDIKERLETRGYTMYLSKNSWSNPEYKGINTRWVTPQGERFEVQFHTPESFHAKHHATHDAYERIRNPMISGRERRELKDFQREVSSAIPIPDGAAVIPDFEKKGF
jgi:hypothetical protein